MDPTLPIVGALAALTLGVFVRRQLRPGPVAVGPGLRALVAHTQLRVSATGPDLSELSGVVEGRPAVVRIEGEGGWVEARLLHPVADTALASEAPAVRAAVQALRDLGCGDVALAPLAVRADLPRPAAAPTVLPAVAALATALEEAGVAPWRAWAQEQGLSLLRRSLPAVDPATTVDRVLARDERSGPRQGERLPDRLDELWTGPEWCLRISGAVGGVQVDLRLDARREGPRLAMRAVLDDPWPGDTVVWARDGQSRDLPGPGHPFADLALVAEGATDPALAATLARPELLEPLLELLHGWPAARLRHSGVTLDAEGEHARLPAAELALRVARGLVRTRTPGPPQAAPDPATR